MDGEAREDLDTNTQPTDDGVEVIDLRTTDEKRAEVMEAAARLVRKSVLDIRDQHKLIREIDELMAEDEETASNDT